jgi:hypothetical protein
MDLYMTGVSYIVYMLASVLVSQNGYQKIFAAKNRSIRVLMRFRAFIEEDSAAVIAQIRDIRDQMRVIKIKRDLEKEKYELQKLKQQKLGEGVMKHRYR